MKFIYMTYSGESYEYSSLEELLYDLLDEEEIDDFINDCYKHPKLPFLGDDYNLGKIIFLYNETLYEQILDDYIEFQVEDIEDSLKRTVENYVDFKEGRIFIAD